MATMAFDTLRYARRLKEAGVPEPQAEVQAELMAEAFGFYADNRLTKDHFNDVINARFAEQDARIEKRLSEQDAKFEDRFTAHDQRFAAQGAQLKLHTWMLGLIIFTLVVPQLIEWFG